MLFKLLTRHKATITALDTESQHTKRVLLCCREEKEGELAAQNLKWTLGPVYWAHKIPQQPGEVLGTANLSHFLPKTHMEIP